MTGTPRSSVNDNFREPTVYQDGRHIAGRIDQDVDLDDDGELVTSLTRAGFLWRTSPGLTKSTDL